jgi:hypothetical protein
MEIKQGFEFVTGNFETTTGELICVCNKKYNSVDLCFKENMNISFAKIRLHSRDTLKNAEAVFESAACLGNEIARR